MRETLVKHLDAPHIAPWRALSVELGAFDRDANVYDADNKRPLASLRPTNSLARSNEQQNGGPPAQPAVLYSECCSAFLELDARLLNDRAPLRRFLHKIGLRLFLRARLATMPTLSNSVLAAAVCTNSFTRR